jgi:hypothetical protein
MRIFALIAALVLTASAYGHDGIFIRGDANDDDSVNVSDMIYISNYLFDSGPAPANFDAADANDDGFVNVSDFGYLNNYLFNGGPQPPGPFATEGIDLTPDDLENLTSPKCYDVWEPNARTASVHVDVNATDPWDYYDKAAFTDGSLFSLTSHGEANPVCNEDFLDTPFSGHVYLDADPCPPHAYAWDSGFIKVSCKVDFETQDYEAGDVCPPDWYLCYDDRPNLMGPIFLELIFHVSSTDRLPTLPRFGIALNAGNPVQWSGDDQAVEYIKDEDLSTRYCYTSFMVYPDGPQTLEFELTPEEHPVIGPLPDGHYQLEKVVVRWSHQWWASPGAPDHSEEEVLTVDVKVYDFKREWVSP